MFDFNVQHDCRLAKCTASGSRRQVQECVESEVTEEFIIHEPVHQYIVNTHAFHNAHLLREVVPQELIAPVLLFENHELKHHELAAELCSSQADRREHLKAGREVKKAAAAEQADSSSGAATQRKQKKRKINSS